MKKQKHPFITRRKFFYTGILGTLGASYTYARYIEPYQLAITRKDIITPRLPASLDGTTIAQLTDLHFQPERHEALISEAIALTNAEKPDIIALTGDYITDTDSVFPPLVPHLSQLKAKHGVYAVLGNHDVWYGLLGTFKTGFQQAGIELLNNRGSTIRIKGEKLFIAGTTSALSGGFTPSKAFQGHGNEPIIALMHEPDVFDRIAAKYPVSLQLSGHTHGGQCRVPIIGYVPAKVMLGKKYIYGQYNLNNSQIFVSRGIGTTAINVRFSCKPEIAIITLRSPYVS